MTADTPEARTLGDRIEAYLDDAPMDGRHSDKAGGNAYQLLEEAAHDLRASSSHEALRTATIEECAKIADSGAHQCVDGDTEWHRGFKYAASNTALGIAAKIRALSDTERQPSKASAVTRPHSGGAA